MLYGLPCIDSTHGLALTTWSRKLITRTSPSPIYHLPCVLLSCEVMAWDRQSLFCRALQDHFVCYRLVCVISGGRRAWMEMPPRVQPVLFHKLQNAFRSLYSVLVFVPWACTKLVQQPLCTLCPNTQREGTQFSVLFRWVQYNVSQNGLLRNKLYECHWSLQ